jgi:hypothetical protein
MPVSGSRIARWHRRGVRQSLCAGKAVRVGYLRVDDFQFGRKTTRRSPGNSKTSGVWKSNCRAVTPRLLRSLCAEDSTVHRVPPKCRLHTLDWPSASALVAYDGEIRRRLRSRVQQIADLFVRQKFRKSSDFGSTHVKKRGPQHHLSPSRRPYIKADRSTRALPSLRRRAGREAQCRRPRIPSRERKPAGVRHRAT